MVDWKKLEDEVNRAIDKGCPISFESNSPKECIYQQKCAEIKLSNYELVLSIIIFLIAIGISYMSTTYKDKDIFSDIIFWLGLSAVILGSIAGLFWMNLYNRCKRIILGAEKRILSETDAEPRTTQETTNTPPQAQENVPSIGGNVGKIEYTKAKLDLLKLIMSGTIVAMASVVIYNLQSSGSNFIPGLFIIIVFGVLVSYLGKQYSKTMDELKDMP